MGRNVSVLVLVVDAFDMDVTLEGETLYSSAGCK